jgi:uncharacterized membrane protein
LTEVVGGARTSTVRTLDLCTIDGKIVTLGTVFFVKSLSYTLISTAILTRTFNVKIKITKSGAVIEKANNKILSSGTSCSGLIVLNLVPLSKSTLFALVA